LPAIQHVVHAAGILDDAALLNLLPEQFEKVFQPKVQGAWNLHQYFENRSLQHFVLFSSGASVLGTVAQGNYVAANHFLDQLAAYRRLKGQQALSINWGNIGEVGLAAADVKRGERLKEQGMGVLLPKDIPAILDGLESLQGQQYMVMDIQFEKWAQANPEVLKNNFFSQLLNIKAEESTKEEGKNFANMAAALKYLRNEVKQHIAAITKVPVLKVKEDATFKSMGIDSLMAVQLKNKFQASFGLTLAVSSIWTYPTVEKYAEFLAEELKIEEQLAPTPVVETPTTEKSVDEMSLEELMRELEEKSK
jgi:acyl carrier protein